MLITLLGIMVGGFLGFVVFGGGWDLRGKSHARIGSASGGFLGGLAAMPMLVNGLFWADEAQITQGVVGLLFWPAALAGAGAGIGWIMDRNSAGQTPPQDAKLPPHKTAMGREGLSQVPSATDDAYDIAGRELQSGAKHAGAWARAMVEADGDPARTEAAYVRLRVATLDATAREEAARGIEAERKAQEDATSRAADALFNQARRQGAPISAEEAKLRTIAKEAIERRRISGARLILIPEVSALAKKIYASYEEAIIAAERDIFRDRHGYRFDGRFYNSLAGAMSDAQKQARYEEKTVTGPAPSTGRISEGKKEPPEGSDDQPPFRWDDFR
jgi:hypothetical protein